MSEKTRITLTEHCYIVRIESILGGEPIVKDTRTPGQDDCKVCEEGVERVEK